MILPDNGGEGSQSERDGEGSSDSLQDAVGSEGGDPVSGRPSSTVSHYSQRSLADRILGRRRSQQLSLKSRKISVRDATAPYLRLPVYFAYDIMLSLPLLMSDREAKSQLSVCRLS